MPEYVIPRDSRNYTDVLAAIQAVAMVFDEILAACHNIQFATPTAIPAIATILNDLRAKEIPRADGRVLHNAVNMLWTLPRSDLPSNGYSLQLFGSWSAAITVIAEFSLFPTNRHMYELLTALRMGPATGPTSEYTSHCLPRVTMQQDGFSYDRQGSTGRGKGKQDKPPEEKKKNTNKAQVSQ